MGADLNGPVAVVRDAKLHALPASVDENPVWLDDDCARGVLVRVLGGADYREDIVRGDGKEGTVQRGVDIAIFGADRIVYGDEEHPGEGSCPRPEGNAAIYTVSVHPRSLTRPDVPIDKGTFHLDLMQKGRDTGQDVPAPKHSLPMLHQLCDGMFAIPDALLKLRRDEGYSLCLIELKAACEPLLGEGTGLPAYSRRWGSKLPVSEENDILDESVALPPLWARYAWFARVVVVQRLARIRVLQPTKKTGGLGVAFAGLGSCSTKWWR